jgi:hypothetical protein
MAGIVGTQDHWVVGSRFFFKPESSISDRIIDIGTVNTVNPAIEPTKVDLRDSGSGFSKIIDSTLTDIAESFEITTKNFSRDNLSYLFVSSAAKELSEEADTAVQMVLTGAATAYPVGTLVKVYNNTGTGNTGQPVYNITANPTNAVSGFSGSITFVVHDAARGILRVSATTLAGTGTITISLVTTDPEPVTNNRRVLVPQTGSLSRLTGRGYIFYSRNNFEYQTVREFKCQITPSNANFQVEDYSDFTLTAKALYEPTNTTAPFGRLVAFAGSTV